MINQISTLTKCELTMLKYLFETDMYEYIRERLWFVKTLQMIAIEQQLDENYITIAVIKNEHLVILVVTWKPDNELDTQCEKQEDGIYKFHGCPVITHMNQTIFQRLKRYMRKLRLTSALYEYQLHGTGIQCSLLFMTSHRRKLTALAIERINREREHKPLQVMEVGSVYVTFQPWDDQGESEKEHEKSSEEKVPKLNVIN